MYKKEKAVWRTMRHRCESPKNKAFHRYGGRGIYVCDRWQDFDKFIDDMGRRPEGGTVERINNEGSYSPENCKWATRLEQSHNKSNNRQLVNNGETKTMAEWARCFEVNPVAILYRINAGWSAEDVLGVPFASDKPNSKLCQELADEIRKQYAKGDTSLNKLATNYAVSKKTIMNIIHNKIWVIK